MLAQVVDEFDGAYVKFKEARAEENALDAVRAEESVARAYLHRASNMDGYEMGTANDPDEEEEE